MEKNNSVSLKWTALAVHNNKTEIIDRFLHDGKWVEDVGENAENFNRYYANVGKARERER